MKTILLALIRAYRYVASPWVGGTCRYWPTCSEYAREAIETHGALRGSWLAVARLARCHPYGRGGVDPVPREFAWQCRCASHAEIEAAIARARALDAADRAHDTAPEFTVSEPIR